MCDVSIVEAKTIINSHIKRYFILVFCWGFTVLPNARVGLTEVQGGDGERGLKSHW